MPKVERALPSPVDVVRQFNRFYTQKIGVLDGGLLDSPFSLTEVRVLYELAHGPGLTATDLILRLGLDAGYVSRILARFARQRLVVRKRSAEDGRQTHLHLSLRGQQIFNGLDKRSSAQVDQLIGHLPEVEQARLVGHLHSVRHLLSPKTEISPTFRLRDLKPGDLGWVVQRHGILYASEYGWNQEFEALVAGIVAEYGKKFIGGRERCWIAELDGQPVGCVFLVRKTGTVAKLRLLLVEPTARGHGVGRRLVEACIGFARAAGYRKIELWTNSVLVAARSIYERAGFQRVRSDAHCSFGHDLVGETWELELIPSVGK